MSGVTSSLSVRRSFCVEDELCMLTGGLPGTMTGVLVSISVGPDPCRGSCESDTARNSVQGLSPDLGWQEMYAVKKTINMKELQLAEEKEAFYQKWKFYEI